MLRTLSHPKPTALHLGGASDLKNSWKCKMLSSVIQLLYKLLNNRLQHSIENLKYVKK